jgi:hypothetical protein
MLWSWLRWPHLGCLLSIHKYHVHIYTYIYYIYTHYIYIYIHIIYICIYMSSGGMWTNILGELLWCWCAEAPNDSIGHEATQMPPSAWAPLMHREGSKPWFASLSDHEFLIHWDGLRENPMVSYRFSWRDLSIEKKWFALPHNWHRPCQENRWLEESFPLQKELFSGTSQKVPADF